MIAICRKAFFCERLRRTETALFEVPLIRSNSLCTVTEPLSSVTLIFEGPFIISKAFVCHEISLPLLHLTHCNRVQ